MKIFLVISIMVNVALAAAIGYKVSNHSARPGEEDTAVTQTNEIARQLLKKKKLQQTVVVTNGASEFTWANVEAADYKRYIANLRKIECPEETIRDIIIADIEKYYRNKLAPFRRPKEEREFKFWKNERYWGPRESAEYYEANRAAEKEKRELIKELLGVDYVEEKQKQFGWSDENDPFNKLPADKKEQIGNIMRKFGDMEQDIYRRANGELFDDDAKELAKIRKQRHDEMAKVLSPEELFEWEVRHSNTAQNMKWNELAGFDATEEEFRAIFKVKQASDYPDPDEDKTVAQERRKSADEQLKQVLGDERYKDYQQAQNWEFRELARLTDGLELGRDVAKKVYGMKDDVMKAAREVRKDQSLTQEQREAKLLEIKTAAEQEIIQSLGQRGFKAYKRNAWWLRELAPQKSSS